MGTNTRPQTDPQTGTHLHRVGLLDAGTCWGRSGDSDSGSAHKSTWGSGGISASSIYSIHPAPRAGSAAPRCPPLFTASSGMCTQTADECRQILSPSAKGTASPALGTAPKPPDSIPRAQPCPLCTPNPSAGCPQELRDTSGHAGTKPSSPAALSPRCLPPAPPPSAFIIREAGNTAGIGSNCCSCPGKAEEQSCGGSYTNV